MFKWFKILRGWIRLRVWGVCPLCNHDAPRLYDCPVCMYYIYLPRYREHQTGEMKARVWYKYLIYMLGKPKVIPQRKEASNLSELEGEETPSPNYSLAVSSEAMREMIQSYQKIIIGSKNPLPMDRIDELMFVELKRISKEYKIKLSSLQFFYDTPRQGNGWDD